MALDTHALVVVSGDLFAEMLGFHVEISPISLSDAGLTMTSEIRILGGTNWLLEVSCPFVTASVIAGRIFRIPPADLDDDLLLDALGEVANIISGNLKGMLEGEHSLSLPSSGIRPPSETSVHASRRICLSLLCDEMPLQLTLCEQSMEPALATA